MKARLKHSAQQLTRMVGYARQHRSAPTPEEAMLWRAINAKQLGVAFRRQVVLGGRYIADFAALGARFVVEVDGAYHRSQRSADRRRDEWLVREGYRVLRLDAELVRRDLAEAVRRVRAALAS